jgi:hypothetical protein
MPLQCNYSNVRTIWLPTPQELAAVGNISEFEDITITCACGSTTAVATPLEGPRVDGSYLLLVNQHICPSAVIKGKKPRPV